MKTQVFTGEYFERGATRKITTTDPGQPGRIASKLEKFDMVTDLVIDHVSGYGKVEKTGELQVTLSGQYGAGCKTCRITAFAQNVDAIKAMLKDNVVKPEAPSADGRVHWPLKEEIVVTAVGSKMTGYGLSVRELYLKNADGTFKTIIAPAAIAVEGATENLADAFL